MKGRGAGFVGILCVVCTGCSEHYVVGRLADSTMDAAPSPPDSMPPAQGLTGQYFDNITLSGSPVLTRVDAVSDVVWEGPGGPAPEIPNSFSARWRGFLTPLTSETYTLRLYCDDDCRVWIDDKLVLSLWDGEPGAGSTNVALQEGKRHKIQIEFFSFGGNASLELSWSSATVTEQVIPTELFAPDL